MMVKHYLISNCRTWQSSFCSSSSNKEGLNFTGWDKAFNRVVSDLDVQAVYTPKTYTVKFYVNAKPYGEAITVAHGADVELPAEPEVPGYKFVKWDKPTTNVTSNLSLNAVLEIRYYKLDS